jgi:hypothetical protein
VRKKALSHKGQLKLLDPVQTHCQVMALARTESYPSWGERVAPYWSPVITSRCWPSVLRREAALPNTFLAPLPMSPS